MTYARQGRPVSISHDDLAAMKDSALIISMQSPEDYAYAHIPGAANVPAKTFIAGYRQLLQLPRDKKIVVACYIGHYSNIGAMILGVALYKATGSQSVGWIFFPLIVLAFGLLASMVGVLIILYVWFRFVP